MITGLPIMKQERKFNSRGGIKRTPSLFILLLLLLLLFVSIRVEKDLRNANESPPKKIQYGDGPRDRQTDIQTK